MEKKISHTKIVKQTGQPNESTVSQPLNQNTSGQTRYKSSTELKRSAYNINDNDDLYSTQMKALIAKNYDYLQHKSNLCLIF